jgi:hypothetical protein
MPDHRLQAQTQRSTAPATLALPGSGLAPCVYVALQCSLCGELRQALSALPSSPVIFCPQCRTACDFVVLGTGFTRRKPPFFEVPRVSTRLLARRGELPSADSPQLILSG